MKYIYYLITALILSSCATIPRASVDMSIRLEQQIYALKQANESIINSVFETKEQNMVSYLDNVLFPEYLEGLFKNPSIREIWDEMVETKNASDRLEVIVWLNKNIQKHYKTTRDSLLMPIQEERQQVLKLFNDEFDMAIRMNSTITRNIASANSIQEAYKDYASKLVDVNRIDSIVLKSLNTMDAKLNSLQRGLDVYQANEQKVKDALKKLK